MRLMHASQRSFSKFFWLVFMWRFLLFHHRPQSAPNVHLQMLQKECFQTAQWKERFNPVRWSHTSERSFSDCFCLDFMWRYFLFYHRPQSAPNVHLQILEKECFQTAEPKERFNSVRSMHTSQRNFSEFFCIVFMWRYFLFHNRPQSAPNVHLQILQKENFKTAQSEERFKYVRWMHTTLRSFSDCFCQILREDISLSTTGRKTPQMSNIRFYKNRVSKLLNQKKALNLWDESTHEKVVSHIASV